MSKTRVFWAQLLVKACHQELGHQPSTYAIPLQCHSGWQHGAYAEPILTVCYDLERLTKSGKY